MQEEEGAKTSGFEEKVPGLSNLEGQNVVIPREDLNKPFKIVKCKDCTV